MQSVKMARRSYSRKSGRKSKRGSVRKRSSYRKKSAPRKYVKARRSSQGSASMGMMDGFSVFNMPFEKYGKGTSSVSTGINMQNKEINRRAYKAKADYEEHLRQMQLTQQQQERKRLIDAQNKRQMTEEGFGTANSVINGLSMVLDAIGLPELGVPLQIANAALMPVIHQEVTGDPTQLSDFTNLAGALTPIVKPFVPMATNAARQIGGAALNYANNKIDAAIDNYVANRRNPPPLVSKPSVLPKYIRDGLDSGLKTLRTGYRQTEQYLQQPSTLAFTGWDDDFEMEEFLNPKKSLQEMFPGIETYQDSSLFKLGNRIQDKLFKSPLVSIPDIPNTSFQPISSKQLRKMKGKGYYHEWLPDTPHIKADIDNYWWGAQKQMSEKPDSFFKRKIPNADLEWEFRNLPETMRLMDRTNGMTKAVQDKVYADRRNKWISIKLAEREKDTYNLLKYNSLYDPSEKDIDPDNPANY